MREFSYASQPGRVVFGAGTFPRVRDEVEALGGTRALILTTPGRSALAARAREILGPLAAGEFTGAAEHTPVEVTGRALEVATDVGADCLVAVGGGSTTGLAKALAFRTGLPQVVVPTTYAGSEVTPVLGETADGVKTTKTVESVRPNTVVYDVELTLGLPVAVSVTSGVNAMAHAVEALYAPGGQPPQTPPTYSRGDAPGGQPPQANPVTDELALRAITLFARALPLIVSDPANNDARADALEAAWLAGICLGTVGMGLQHKLCHTLGGSFGLPHAATHTVVLPHAMAYNAPAVPEVMERIARALDPDGTRPDAPTAMFDLIGRLGGPRSLAELGLAKADLARAAELATATPYPNPRPVTYEGISALLASAWSGTRPVPADPVADQLRTLQDAVVASFGSAPDPRARELLTGLVRTLHGFAAAHDVTQDEWRFAIDFLTRTGQISSDTRQEFILLSDTLGVSSAVDVLTNSRTAGATPSAVLGPFYVEGPPVRDQGFDIADGLGGAPLYVDVMVTDGHGAPLAEATVDVWQSNDDGFYDVQLPDVDGPVLRARFLTNAAGRLRFWSIVPVPYPIPADGPVGQMLRATGRHEWRAPHLHFMISAPGAATLITQLFVAGGDYIDGDTVFGVKRALVVDYPEHQGPTPDGRVVKGPWHRLDYTFRLADA